MGVRHGEGTEGREAVGEVRELAQAEGDEGEDRPGREAGSRRQYSQHQAVPPSFAGRSEFSKGRFQTSSCITWWSVRTVHPLACPQTSRIRKAGEGSNQGLPKPSELKDHCGQTSF